MCWTLTEAIRKQREGGSWQCACLDKGTRYVTRSARLRTMAAVEMESSAVFASRAMNQRPIVVQLRSQSHFLDPSTDGNTKLTHFTVALVERGRYSRHQAAA